MECEIDFSLIVRTLFPLTTGVQMYAQFFPRRKMDDVIDKYWDIISTRHPRKFYRHYVVANFLNYVILQQNDQNLASAFLNEMFWHGRMDILLKDAFISKVLDAERCRRFVFNMYREKFREEKKVKFIVEHCISKNDPKQLIEWIEYFGISRNMVILALKKLSINMHPYENYKFIRHIKKYFKKQTQ